MGTMKTMLHALALMMPTAREYGNTVEPDWKRKKCKSCRDFKNACSNSTHPMDDACHLYAKRK